MSNMTFANGSLLPPSKGAFVALLNRCKAQVDADPDGYLENPHLYDILHGVYLRLCHPNIPDFGVEKVTQ